MILGVLETSGALIATVPASVKRDDPVGSNDKFQIARSVLSVCKHSPLLEFQILMVLSFEADASRVES